jgi:cell shape-determining protein MreC
MPQVSQQLRRRTRPFLRSGAPVVIGLTILALGVLLGFLGTGVPTFIAAPIQRVGVSIFSARSRTFAALNSALPLLSSKRALSEENRLLAARIADAQLRLTALEGIVAENAALRQAHGMVPYRGERIATRVLAKPPLSPHGTLVIDAGERSGISVGDMVVAGGAIAVGSVARVFSHSSIVELFSLPGRESTFYIGDDRLPITARGIGSNNVIIEVPRSMPITKGNLLYVAHGETYAPLAPLYFGMLGHVEAPAESPTMRVIGVSALGEARLHMLEVRIGSVFEGAPKQAANEADKKDEATLNEEAGT